MLDCSVSDINQVFSNFKNLQTKKRNFEKKLELIEGENDLLHEEIHEIKAMLENFQNKSDSSNNSFKHKKVSDVKTPQMEANLVAMINHTYPISGLGQKLIVATPSHKNTFLKIVIL